MNNIQIYNLEQQIIELINNSNLPIYIVYMILREIYNEIERITIQQLIDEQAQEFDKKGELYGKKIVDIDLQTGKTTIKEEEGEKTNE